MLSRRANGEKYGSYFINSLTYFSLIVKMILQNKQVVNSLEKRIEKWDILKFFLMFLVVLGHIAAGYTYGYRSMRSLYVLIYSFHMPLFIFLSGMFSKNTINNKRYSKMFSYLLIYIFSKFLFSLYGLFDSGKFEFNLIKGNGLPWYMLAMFVFMLVTSSLQNIKPKYVLAFSIALALIAGYDPWIKDILAASRIIVFFPFFYLGYLVEPDRIQKLTDKVWIKVVSAFIIILATVLVFSFSKYAYLLRPMFTGRNPYTSLHSYKMYGAAIRLVCYVISAVMGFAFIAITPNRTPFGIIAKFGTRTVGVYVFHYFVIYLLYNQLGIKAFFESLFSGNGAGYMVLPLALIITVVLSLKPFSVPINVILKIPQKAVLKK